MLANEIEKRQHVRELNQFSNQTPKSRLDKGASLILSGHPH